MQLISRWSTYITLNLFLKIMCFMTDTFLHNDPYNTNGSCVPIHKIAALHHVLQSLIENILKTVWLCQ